MKVTALYYFR